MVRFLHLQISPGHDDMTNRERKLLEVMVLHQCAHATYRLLGEPARVRPVDLDAIHLAMNHVICFENPITLANASALGQTIVKNVQNALEMCALMDFQVQVFPLGEQPIALGAAQALN